MDNLYLGTTEYQKIIQKYPGRIPIFVTRSSNSKDISDIPKKKYLAPAQLSIGQFIYIIRKQIQLPPEKALFVFVNNTLPTSVTTLAEVYSQHKSPDGALRMVYTSESTFGF
jgi:GABA(A) receptor-associated protein